MGELNCGTQLKMSSILTGIFTVLLAYRFVKWNKSIRIKVLHILGDFSFGIYFLHLAIMWVLNHI